MTSPPDRRVTSRLDKQEVRAGLPLPPGPRGLRGVGVVPHLLRDIYGYLPKVARRYGDVVRLPVPGADLILLNHPDHVNHVMSKHASRYWKGEMNQALLEGEHPGLPLSDGDTWKRMRRLLSPKFTEQSMSELSTKVVDEIDRHLQRWDDAAAGNRAVALEDDLATMTLSVMLRGAMSIDIDDTTIDAAGEHLRRYGKYAAGRMLMYSVPNRVPRPFARSGHKSHQWLSDLFDRTVDERRTNPRSGSDLLSLLLDARYDDGEPMTPEELRGEMAGLVFGGFETTASALAWTFTLLALNPEAALRAYEEVDALQGRRPTFTDLSQLTFLRACFDESMRIQGGPLYARSPLVDDAIGGYRIPKGSTVIVSPTVLHQDRRFWIDPERFNPDRFTTDKIDRNAFIPFNVGQRKCLGLRLAYMEGTFAIAAVLQRYRFRLPEGFELRPAFRLSTGIKGGVDIWPTHR
ncbi:MAG: cytochrome P450 [Woeseiaceae bacterium]